MGINWNHVIRDHMKGMDLATAYYLEDKRCRDERIRELRKRDEEARRCRDQTSHR